MFSIQRTYRDERRGKLFALSLLCERFPFQSKLDAVELARFVALTTMCDYSKANKTVEKIEVVDFLFSGGRLFKFYAIITLFQSHRNTYELFDMGVIFQMNSGLSFIHKSQR